MTTADAALARLESVLAGCGPAVVAVSGGVDSMTLAAVAARVLGPDVTMYHARSPAVPAAATARVERHAARGGWALVQLDAGEFEDPRYLVNPVNRCYFCKQNLYGALSAATPAQLLSGTNLDDLDDWRPGLEAAAAAGVRHPFVEAQIDKRGVRAIARLLGLEDLAELPAAPCLSSRVETGIPIVAGDLAFIDRAEREVRATLPAASTVRVRLRRSGIVLELDASAHAALAPSAADTLRTTLSSLAQAHGVAGEVRLEVYARGGAFLRAAP